MGVLPPVSFVTPEHGSLFGIFLLLALGGYVIPLPEEVLLLFAGYLAGSLVNTLPATLTVSWLGVLGGDFLLFTLSRLGSHSLDRLRRRVSPARLEWYAEKMRDHIGKTIVALRFVIGLRFLSPLLAGTLRVPWRTFLFFDALALVVYVPLPVLLGYHFHETIAAIIPRLTGIRHGLFILFAVLVGMAISRFVHRKFLVKYRGHEEP